MSVASRTRSLPFCVTLIVGLGCGDTQRGVRVGTDAAPETEVAAPDALAETTPDAIADTVEPDVETLTPDIAPEVSEVLTPVDVVETACACNQGQECAAPCQTIGDVCARDGYPDGTERRYCRPPGAVGESCQNQFREFYIPCAERLSCLVPDPDEPDTVSYCFACAAQRFTVSGECAMPIGIFWDGSACLAYSGCACEGEDCGVPYPSMAACQRVARACAAVQADP